jgi:ATP-dependent Clp protease protease subunit
MAAILLAAGTRGKRYSLPNSRVLIHQPHASGLGGQAADIEIQARDILRTRELMNQILADATGQPLEKIVRDVDRDYIMEPRQALEYGIIDRVITRRELPGNTPPPGRLPLNGSGR